MLVANTNYVEPVNINMMEVVEDKFTEDFFVIDAKEATEGLVIKDNNVDTTNDYAISIEMMNATEGLWVKFQEVKINDGRNLEVKMVDMTRNAERDGVERHIQKEEDQIKVVYPKASEILLHFLVRSHKKIQRLLCALDAVPSDKKALEDFKRVQFSQRKGDGGRQEQLCVW